MSKTDNILDLRRLWRAIRQLRWVYVISMAGFITLAVAYWLVALPQYKASGMLLVEDSDMSAGAGDMGQMMKTFSIGGFGGAAVDNEMLIMNSHDVAMKVVKNLELNRTYTARIDGEKKVLWGNSPISVEAAPGYFDTLSVALKVVVDILDNGNADIKVTKGLLGRTVGEAENVTLPATVKTKFGNLQVFKTPEYDKTPYTTVKVSVCSYEAACKQLMKVWFIDVASKLGDAILVEYDAPNRQMGMDVVNAIMGEYNAKRLDRTHSRAAEEVAYYDEAIAKLMVELGDVEKKEVKFLSGEGLFANQETATILAGTAMSNKMDDIQARQTIKYYEKVLDAIDADTKGEEFVPVVDGITDENVKTYNEAIFYKRDLLKSATENNAALQRLNDRISMLRKVMIESSKKSIDKAKNELQALGNVTASATSQLVGVPQKKIEYESLARDKTLKNALYSFLRQSREQSMLQLYSTTSLGFVFEEAYCDLKPNNTKKYIIVIVLLMLGLVCPTCLAVLFMLRHKKITDLMDLAKLGIESQSVIFDGTKVQTNSLRALITEHPKLKMIYMAGYDCNGQMVKASLSESLTAIDKKVAMLPSESDNDALFGSQWITERDAALALSDYVIMSVPNPDRLPELAHMVDTTDCQLLVCVGSGKVNAALLKTVLKGMPADKVRVCIIK